MIELFFTNVFWICLLIVLVLIGRVIYVYFYSSKYLKRYVRLDKLNEVFLLLFNGEIEFLILEIPDVRKNEKFLQFTYIPNTGVQLDLPLITNEQLELKPKLLKVLNSKGLKSYETVGTSGDSFLDVDIYGEIDEIVGTVSSVIQETFDLKSDDLIEAKF